MVKCNSCGGTYEPILADGMRYFHACAPLSVVELKDAIARGAVRLTKPQQTQLEAATAADGKGDPAEGERSHVDQLLAALVVERPDRRDENITGAGAPGAAAPLRAEGLGLTTVEA